MIAVIDMDSIVYRSAAVGETASIIATHASGATKEFKNRTEFKELLKSKNKLHKIDEYSIEDHYIPEPLDFCLHTIKCQVSKIEEATQATQLVCVIGGKDNFRDSLELPSKYKGNREGMHRPIHLEAARQYVMDKYKAEVINGHEADDAIIYKALELKQAGYDAIVVSADKDSLQCDGITIYDFTKEKFIHNEGHWFDIAKTTGGSPKPNGSGVGFLMCQVAATGDITDNYNPKELTKIRYGLSNYKKDTAGFTTAQQYLEIAKRNFQKWYPSPVTYTAWNGQEYTKDWKQLLDLYFKCAYMKRTPDDNSCSIEFFNSYGVEL